jgi:hypothetical protein
MPDVLTESAKIYSGGATPLLDQEIFEAEEQIDNQRKTIARLSESHELIAARKKLLSMLENLAFLRKLSCA